MDAGEPEPERPARRVDRMFWAVGSALGLVMMTGLIMALARPVTARWEREHTHAPSTDE